MQDGIVAQIGASVPTWATICWRWRFSCACCTSFRRREVNALRWAVLLMWAAAVFGMALLGNGDPSAPVGANQIGVLFLPVMLGFGLAFVLVLFSRREGARGTAARSSFHRAVPGVGAAADLHPAAAQRAALPISALLRTGHQPAQGWTKPDEIIGSDMPWAVAWYADRKSLWIPNKFADFMGMSDYAKLPGPLAGLFLTTLSRNEPFYSSIYRGEYQDWQPLIFGRTDLPSFPFKEGILVLGDLSYTFYSDTKRWERPSADTP